MSIENFSKPGIPKEKIESFNVFNIEQVEQETSNTEDIFEYYDPKIHGSKEGYKSMIEGASHEQGERAGKVFFDEVPPQSESNF